VSQGTVCDGDPEAGTKPLRGIVAELVGNPTVLNRTPIAFVDPVAHVIGAHCGTKEPESEKEKE
jgi:hypothetical protein